MRPTRSRRPGPATHRWRCLGVPHSPIWLPGQPRPRGAAGRRGGGSSRACAVPINVATTNNRQRIGRSLQQRGHKSPGAGLARRSCSRRRPGQGFSNWRTPRRSSDRPEDPLPPSRTPRAAPALMTATLSDRRSGRSRPRRRLDIGRPASTCAHASSSARMIVEDVRESPADDWCTTATAATGSTSAPTAFGAGQMFRPPGSVVRAAEAALSAFPGGAAEHCRLRAARALDGGDARRRDGARPRNVGT